MWCVFSVDNQLKYAQTQLDKLKKTNVFNTTFHIWLVSFSPFNNPNAINHAFRSKFQIIFVNFTHILSDICHKLI